MKALRSVAASFPRPRGSTLAWLALGLGLKLNLFALWANPWGYLEGVAILVQALTAVGAAVGGAVAGGFGWVGDYLGVFALPLLGCIAYSAWHLGRFVGAALRNQPISLDPARVLHGRATFVGVDLAGLLGMTGTLVYIIAGLGVLATNMISLAQGIGGGAPVSGQLGPILEGMAAACSTMVPALGTTVAAVASECLVVCLERLGARWHGPGWTGEGR